MRPGPENRTKLIRAGHLWAKKSNESQVRPLRAEIRSLIIRTNMNAILITHLSAWTGSKCALRIVVPLQNEKNSRGVRRPNNPAAVEAEGKKKNFGQITQRTRKMQRTIKSFIYT
jgi:hypothetical protein